MTGANSLSRRDLLQGRIGKGPSGGPGHHISSAVVSALPARVPEVIERLNAMEGVEVHASENSKIVVTLEGPSAGALGERLTRIALTDGVISANMVFEHFDGGEEAAK